MIKLSVWHQGMMWRCLLGAVVISIAHCLVVKISSITWIQVKHSSSVASEWVMSQIQWPASNLMSKWTKLQMKEPFHTNLRITVWQWIRIVDWTERYYLTRIVYRQTWRRRCSTIIVMSMQWVRAWSSERVAVIFLVYLTRTVKDPNRTRV